MPAASPASPMFQTVLWLSVAVVRPSSPRGRELLLTGDPTLPKPRLIWLPSPESSLAFAIMALSRAGRLRIGHGV